MTGHSLELFHLRELSKRYPTSESALARLACLRAFATLPVGTVHVISDIHGEFKKLRHIINNGSGSLRALVDTYMATSLTGAERQQLLNFIHYPRETWSLLELHDPAAREALLRNVIRWEFALLRELSNAYPIAAVAQTLPKAYRELFREFLFSPQLQRSEAFESALIDTFVAHDRGLDLLRITARAIRNSLITELVIAGDLGDRGPRIDRVLSYLMRQPRVSITWGNHDATWMGACLGHEACIATVLRVSLRYRRLSQLEEGYGIITAPLEKLAREVYGDDPAQQFSCKGEGLREELLLRRMQKAIAICQFKLEGQLIQRNPQFAMEHRNLLHRIDPQQKTVTIGDETYPLTDHHFPTIDWSDPYRLSPEEQACMERLRQSFLQSPMLWEQMQFVLRRGAMYLVRENHLIFHACVPVDEKGVFLSFEVDGVQRSGRALFDALGLVVARAFRKADIKDLDVLWYLWAGERSPWFGKDKMATFEGYFVADQASHKEIKNPYFKLIHDRDFCARVLREFDVSPDKGMIVNGHVPVKIDEGESPLKASGMAVTIDGAFSEAYGDKGYTLVIDHHGSYLVQHHHFDSVEESILRGQDIVPAMTSLRSQSAPILAAESEQGRSMREEAKMLEALLAAYEQNLLPESLG
ncbi:MAG: fructose-bisphosphatase class III [Bdellovibrionales bacterium]|nr:fructose-bisphosphatase class III [Bdellovibrionales bacterium]